MGPVGRNSSSGNRRNLREGGAGGLYTDQKRRGIAGLAAHSSLGRLSGHGLIQADEKTQIPPLRRRFRSGSGRDDKGWGAGTVRRATPKAAGPSAAPSPALRLGRDDNEVGGRLKGTGFGYPAQARADFTSVCEKSRPLNSSGSPLDFASA